MFGVGFIVYSEECPKLKELCSSTHIDMLCSCWHFIEIDSYGQRLKSVTDVSMEEESAQALSDCSTCRLNQLH